MITSRAQFYDPGLDSLDITEYNVSPTEAASPDHALYFVVFVMLAAFFIMNVFVA
jgi:hypothetical protein